jgi:CRISPR-associated protein Cas8b1/Cst1 subtype I-B
MKNEKKRFLKKDVRQNMILFFPTIEKAWLKKQCLDSYYCKSNICMIYFRTFSKSCTNKLMTINIMTHVNDFVK